MALCFHIPGLWQYHRKRPVSRRAEQQPRPSGGCVPVAGARTAGRAHSRRRHSVSLGSVARQRWGGLGIAGQTAIFTQHGLWWPALQRWGESGWSPKSPEWDRMISWAYDSQRSLDSLRLRGSKHRGNALFTHYAYQCFAIHGGLILFCS